MTSGREHRHVHPDLGHDRLCGPLAHPGDGVQLISGPSERDEHSVDVGVEFGDRGLQLRQVPKGQAHQQGVMVPEPATQRLVQLGQLVAQPPWASSANT
jgi:hypothetical protein